MQSGADLTKVAVDPHNSDQEADVQLSFDFMKELQSCSWHIKGDGTFHKVSSCVVLGCVGH